MSAEHDAEALVGASLYVAIADREVERPELDVVVERVEQLRPELTRAETRQIVGRVIAALLGDGRESFLRKLARGVDDSSARSAVAAATATAAADGALGELESERLHQVARAFGVSERELDSMRRLYAEETGRDPETLARPPRAG